MVNGESRSSLLLPRAPQLSWSHHWNHALALQCTTDGHVHDLEQWPAMFPAQIRKNPPLVGPNFLPCRQTRPEWSCLVSLLLKLGEPCRHGCSSPCWTEIIQRSWGPAEIDPASLNSWWGRRLRSNGCTCSCSKVLACAHVRSGDKITDETNCPNTGGNSDSVFRAFSSGSSGLNIAWWDTMGAGQSFEVLTSQAVKQSSIQAFTSVEPPLQVWISDMNKRICVDWHMSRVLTACQEQ